MVYRKVSNKQYWAIKDSLTSKERQLIDYYELQWIMKSYVPTIEECATYLKSPQVEINYMHTRRPLIKALEDRGIPWQQHTQIELTSAQVAAAVTVMNFADTRSTEAKLDQLGINPSQYYAWLKDPAFKNLVDSLADQNLTNIRPAAIAEFTKKVNAGDWNAVKFFLETTGEMQNNDLPKSEQLIKMLIEIIQKHVKDPAVIVAIAQDIKLASANRTLEVAVERPAINSYVVDDDLELEEARKKLGV